MLRFLPLIPGFSEPPQYDHAAVELGKVKSLRLLTALENLLAQKQWLVGDQLTLADIMVAIYVSRGLEWVLDAKWRELHPKIMKHFNAVAKQEAVAKVIPHFLMIEVETPNINPYK